MQCLYILTIIRTENTDKRIRLEMQAATSKDNE